MRKVALSLAICIASVAGSGVATAFQGGEDASHLNVLLEKRYAGAGKNELSAFGALSVVDKFNEYGLSGFLTYNYHLTEYFSLELMGGYLRGADTSILASVRAGGDDPDLTDLMRIKWFSGANVIFSPLYGKISAFSEGDLNLNIYAVAGGGVAGLEEQTSPEDADGNATVVSQGTKPTFNFGGGGRLFFLDDYALRVEVRDFFFYETAQLSDISGTRTEKGFTHNLMLMLGFSYLF